MQKRNETKVLLNYYFFYKENTKIPNSIVCCIVSYVKVVNGHDRLIILKYRRSFNNWKSANKTTLGTYLIYDTENIQLRSLKGICK